MSSDKFVIRRLTAGDLGEFRLLMEVFAETFADAPSYRHQKPGDAYVRKLLQSLQFVCLVAECRGEIAGGLAAYELIKFEQERSEMYIYDLAVVERFRRQGVATQLIQTLKPIAAGQGAAVMFVQADHGDDPAIALYTKLGAREDVLHFDILTEE